MVQVRLQLQDLFLQVEVNQRIKRLREDVKRKLIDTANGKRASRQVRGFQASILGLSFDWRRKEWWRGKEWKVQQIKEGFERAAKEKRKMHEFVLFAVMYCLKSLELVYIVIHRGL